MRCKLSLSDLGILIPGIICGCLSSPDPEVLEWKSVVRERDGVPYEVGASGATGIDVPENADGEPGLIVAPVGLLEKSREDIGPKESLEDSEPLLASPASVVPPLQSAPFSDGQTDAQEGPVSAGDRSSSSTLAEVSDSVQVPPALTDSSVEMDPSSRESVAGNPGNPPSEEREPLPLPGSDLPEEARLDPGLLPQEEQGEAAAEIAPIGGSGGETPSTFDFEGATSNSASESLSAAGEPLSSRTAPVTWNDSVVARVNGAPILMSELKEFALDEGLPLQGVTAHGIRGESFRRAMSARVDQTLLVQAAGLENLEADELEVARRVDAFIAQRVDEAGGRAEFLRSLRDAQLNLDAFRELLLKRESRRQMAAGIVSRRVTISNAELEAFTEDRKTAGEPVEEVRLAQILVACPEDERDSAFGKQQFSRALELAARAGRQPAAFSKILAEINRDPTGRESGGLLGWIDPNGLEPSLQEAVSNLHPGEVSEPVASDAGFHVLFLLDRKNTRDMLYAVKFEEERRKLVEDLRARAQIDIYLPDSAG